MHRFVAVALVLCTMVLFSWSVMAAGDADNGKSLSKSCTCHKNDLDGMAPDSFISQMKGYKDGSIEQKIMNRIAAKYSEVQIADLAAYFASK